FKTFHRLLGTPSYLGNLLRVQASKSFHNFRPPKDGRAKKIRQYSVRITDLCNLRCHTCGQWGESGYLHNASVKELRQKEVSPARHIELLRDLKANGHTPSVYLWGGEPMLYPGAMEVIEEAARLGMPPSIATNATGLARRAERIVAAPMFLVQISLDGPSAEIHNASRPGHTPRVDNFATVTRAIEALSERRRARQSRLPLLVSLTTINHQNYDRLIDIYDRFKDQLDAFVFYLSWWIDQEAAEAHTADFKERFGFAPRLHYGWIGGWRPPDYRLLSAQLTELNRRARRLSGPAVVILPPLTDPAALKTYYTDHEACFGFDKCVSIYSAVEIDSNGDMSPCRDYHDFVVGNVKEQTVTQLWNSAPYVEFRQSLSSKGLMSACTRCCGLMGY
ncbi:MAG: radical SAM protein, partial [Deltaproteobacteria bacterium]|nr:radical SAM protein [Deltaproteobacteria bacterium]